MVSASSVDWSALFHAYGRADDVPGELDAVAAGRSLGNPSYFGLTGAAALSLWVQLFVWRNGVMHRREYVDGIPAGPMETVRSDGHADGFRFVFDLDQEWLPPISDPRTEIPCE